MIEMSRVYTARNDDLTQSRLLNSASKRSSRGGGGKLDHSTAKGRRPKKVINQLFLEPGDFNQPAPQPRENDLMNTIPDNLEEHRSEEESIVESADRSKDSEEPDMQAVQFNQLFPGDPENEV